MFTVQELTTPVTRAQWEESIYATMAALGTGTTNWKPGAVVRAIVTAVSVMLAAVSELVAALASSAFLRTSEGSWKELLAQEVYGITRFPATFAAGQVRLINSGGGVYVMAAGELVLLNTSTGKSYRNASSLTIGAGANFLADFIATEEGSASSAVPGAIDALVTTLDGVTCTNPAALNGVDAETDAALETRCIESLGATSASGPKDAYAAVAKATLRTDGSRIGVSRVRTVREAAGGLTVYVATPTGAVAGGDVAVIQSAVELACEPLCVASTVASATPVTVAVTYQVWLYNDTGKTAAQIEADVSAALAAWFAVRPIAGDVIGATGAVWREQLVAVIGGAVPECFRVVVTTPVADVVLAPEEVPILGTVTATVTQVARSPL